MAKQKNAPKTKQEHKTMPKVISQSRNRIHIIGDNILYCNGKITAFYILPTMNYSTASIDGVLRSITENTNLLAGIASQRPELEFTIERIEKTVKAKDVRNNLLETIQMYRPDYEMPPEFSTNISDEKQTYCLLCIDIQQQELSDVEDYTITDTVKQLFKSAVTSLAGTGNVTANDEKILDIEENIYLTIRHKCVRASKELVFYNYVSKLYPSYEISYDKQSFMNDDNFETIMGAVNQTVSDNFGWFELHNEGVELFGIPAQTTYGCMLDISAFPKMIYSYNFPMDYPGCITTIKCVKKDDAKLKIKRTRSADKYEFETAAGAGAETEALEETAESINIATQALQEIENGDVICQFNCSILVTAESRDLLKQKIMRIVADCKDRDILVSKSLSQATDFLDNYVNLSPKKYAHMASLQFPLSFQLNQGSLVGDTGTGVFSPSIGTDLS